MRIRKNHLLLLGLFSWALFSHAQTSQIEYKNKFYTLLMNGQTGSVQQLYMGDEPLLQPFVADEPLFRLRFRDRSKNGDIEEINALEAQEVQCRQFPDSIVLLFDKFPQQGLRAEVVVGTTKKSPDIHWNIRVWNANKGGDKYLDHIDFPRLVVPNDLIGLGGRGRLFWPAQEGCLVDNVDFRSRGGVPHQELGFPSAGWGGCYPTSAQMQFMAHYNDKAGLYIATHDISGCPKGFEFAKTQKNGIMLELRLFTNGTQGDYQLPYDVVTSVFQGDWHDAADLYRNWVQHSEMPLPPKIAENPDLPEWYHDSPVVITYPVRGKFDMGDMTPNKLYPYTNALPIIENYGKMLNSRIMALLMHWEGSAPWSPPYVWPPYGGEEKLNEFISGLHAKNNLIGLYASGIGYTLRSNTDTTYNNYREYEEKGLKRVMKVGPNGDLAWNNVCAGPNAQRLGWDMCPANEFVTEVVTSQVQQIAQHEVDYVQYFDQNLGGGAYHCYGDKEHHHPYGPGKWLTEAMQHVLDNCRTAASLSNRKMLVGCEAAAAEPFMQYLRFNDARATINLSVGIPVPAYAYVYHEYVNNFMGNQNQVSGCIDHRLSPYNLQQRLAYAFVAGDMFTFIIRDDGDLIWDWDGSWEGLMPNQQNAIDLVRNLNAWRRESGKDFLVYGRMLKPLEFSGSYPVPMYNKIVCRDMLFASVFSCQWEHNGRKAQFFVNYLPDKQTIQLCEKPRKARLHINPSDNKGTPLRGNCIELPPLNAVMVTY